MAQTHELSSTQRMANAILESLGEPVSLQSLGFSRTVPDRFGLAGKPAAWINKIVSLGLSRTGPAYVPNTVDAVVVEANPAGTGRQPFPHLGHNN